MPASLLQEIKTHCLVVVVPRTFASSKPSVNDICELHLAKRLQGLLEVYFRSQGLEALFRMMRSETWKCCRLASAYCDGWCWLYIGRRGRAERLDPYARF